MCRLIAHVVTAAREVVPAAEQKSQVYFSALVLVCNCYKRNKTHHVMLILENKQRWCGVMEPDVNQFFLPAGNGFPYLQITVFIS